MFVVKLRPERETDSAYYAWQGWRAAWFPKVASRVYVQASDADIDELTVEEAADAAAEADRLCGRDDRADDRGAQPWCEEFMSQHDT
ncbi:hypothetical protein [Halorussus marinus]|uniref:hypothetical protein n=1 Tax=Halorussus marinus TaxID=2505976 RepID=UPI00106E4D98|nr:hypothetical protein [Halorussus marinus]